MLRTYRAQHYRQAERSNETRGEPLQQKFTEGGSRLSRVVVPDFCRKAVGLRQSLLRSSASLAKKDHILEHGICQQRFLDLSVGCSPPERRRRVLKCQTA